MEYAKMFDNEFQKYLWFKKQRSKKNEDELMSLPMMRAKTQINKLKNQNEMFRGFSP